MLEMMLVVFSHLVFFILVPWLFTIGEEGEE